jgi:uncharacterized integral membrane protein
MVMRKFVSYVIIIPLALIIIAFAVANRHVVTVSFDPLNAADPALSLEMPLFWVIFAATILGVLIGGSAAWYGQRHWRRAARRHEADARETRAQLAEMKAAHVATHGEPARLIPPSQGGFFGAGGRDKHGAAL